MEQGVLNVPRVALGQGPRYSTMRLTILASGQARVRPSPLLLASNLLLTAAGGSLFQYVLVGIHLRQTMTVGMAAIGAIVFLSLGLAGLWTWIAEARRPILLDRPGGRLSFRPARPDARHYSPADVLAVQACGPVTDGDATAINLYELNLVLTGGRRVNLTRRNHRPSLSREARRLAEFLDRPLLDHMAPTARASS